MGDEGVQYLGGGVGDVCQQNPADEAYVDLSLLVDGNVISFRSLGATNPVRDYWIDSAILSIWNDTTHDQAFFGTIVCQESRLSGCAEDFTAPQGDYRGVFVWTPAGSAQSLYEIINQFSVEAQATITPTSPPTATIQPTYEITLTAIAALQGEQCGDDYWWRMQSYNQNNNPRPRTLDGEVTNAHHGILDSWMLYHFAAFPNSYSSSAAPTVLMPESNHLRTRRAQEALFALHRAPGSRRPDYSGISWQEVVNTAEAMFNESDTPFTCQNRFWEAFRAYAREIICEIVDSAVEQISGLPLSLQDMWQFTGYQSC